MSDNSSRHPNGFPVGTYTSTGDDELWTHTFHSNGTFRVENATELVVEGTYTVAGDQLELTDQRGLRAAVDAKPGTYRWTVDQDHVIFTMLDDEVEGRVTALTSHPWVRQA